MKLGKLHIKASRWPWQERERRWYDLDAEGNNWGWGRISGMARFGGGWDWKLGIDISWPCSFILNLVFGLIRIEWRRHG